MSHRVLVTGVSGFVGSHLANELTARGFSVTGLYRRELDPAAPRAGAVDLVQGDLTTLAALPGPVDAIVHAAASSAWTDISAEAMVRDNIVGTLNLLDLAERAHCTRFIYCSSVSVYGRITVPRVDEATPVVDPDVYGASKLLGERLLEERQDRLPGLALRLPGVIGRGARRNWLSSVGGRLKRGEPIEVFNATAEFNNAIHVLELATFVAEVLERGWSGFDSIVLGCSGTIIVRDAVERLAAGMRLTPDIRAIESPKPPFTLSSDRAVERWGFRPAEIGSVIDRYSSELAA